MKMINGTKTCVGFGIVGCGMIADFHAQALSAVSGAKLIGVTDVNLTNAQSFAQKHGISAYENYQSMLCDDTVEAVCICAIVKKANSIPISSRRARALLSSSARRAA